MLNLNLLKKATRVSIALIALIGVSTTVKSSAQNSRTELRPGASRVMLQEAESHETFSLAKIVRTGTEVTVPGTLTAPAPPVPPVAQVAKGMFVLVGTPLPDGRVQQFSTAVLYRCFVDEKPQGQFNVTRNSCDSTSPTYAGVNENVSLDAGYYLLGYENSIFPGVVKVESSMLTRVQLQQIAIPPGKGTYRIFRDLTKLDEQIKIYFTTFGLGRHLFHEMPRASFTDLYVSGANGDIDVLATWNGSLKICDQNLISVDDYSQKAARLCTARQNANFMAMAEFFDFDSDSRFLEYGFTKGGVPSEVEVGRLLVAVPFTAEQATYINVLPGYYQGDIYLGGGAHRSFPIPAQGATSADGRILGNYGVFATAQSLALNPVVKRPSPTPLPSPLPGAPPLPTKDLGPDDAGDDGLAKGQSCSTAAMWKTEYRAHCRNDNQDGCNRTTAQLCEPMYNTK